MYWKKDLQLFQNTSSQIFFDFDSDQKRLVLHSFIKLLKENYQKWKSGRSRP